MIAFGNTKHLITGAIVLTALGIGAYNSSALMSIYEQKMPGQSRETKFADQKWRQLEELSHGEKSGIVGENEIKAIVARFRRYDRGPASEMPETVGEVQTGLETQEASADSPSVSTEEIEIQPPPVTGILTRKDARGEIRRLAVMAGRIVGENDRVDGFTVKQITIKGVVVTKGAKQWYVPNPQVHFSVDHGG